MNENEFSFGKLLGGFVIVLILVIGATWLFQGSDFFMYRWFAPKYEAVRRQTFEQTRSFTQGTIQTLEDEQRDYLRQTDPKAKDAIASIIKHDSEGFNLNDPNVPATLREFILGLK